MSRRVRRLSALSPTGDGGEALALGEREKTKRRSARKRSGARLPGMKGGAVLGGASVPKNYVPKSPRFPLRREEVLLKCQRKHLPLICGGHVLAIMDMMDEKKCTIHHLHDMTKIGYATIYNYLELENFPNTIVVEQLVISLGYESLEFSIMANCNVKEFLG